MTYTNKQIAEKLAKLILNNQSTNSSFSNGTINYENQTFNLPQQNSLKRKTYLTNR